MRHCPQFEPILSHTTPTSAPLTQGYPGHWGNGEPLATFCAPASAVAPLIFLGLIKAKGLRNGHALHRTCLLSICTLYIHYVYNFCKLILGYFGSSLLSSSKAYVNIGYVTMYVAVACATIIRQQHVMTTKLNYIDVLMWHLQHLDHIFSMANHIQSSIAQICICLQPMFTNTCLVVSSSHFKLPAATLGNQRHPSPPCFQELVSLFSPQLRVEVER